MNKSFPALIGAIAAKYPAILSLLNEKAALLYCEYKATERDPTEPGKDEKDALERKIRRLIKKRLQRQLELIRQQLHENYGKSIIVGGVLIDDHGDEAAQLIKLIYAAMLSGVELTSSQIGIYLADGSINQQALQAARTYVTEWLAQLDGASQNAVRNAIETFVKQPGTTVGDMVDMLEPSFGEARSWRIAVTETTRVYAQAADMYSQELQKQYPDMRVTKQWWTNNDDRVCPICGPLHGKEVGKDEMFNEAMGIDNPPAHVNCRCWVDTVAKA